MSRRAALAAAGLTAAAAVLAWLLFVGLPRWYGPRPAATTAAAPAAPDVVAGRKIKARLFYVTEDGARLTGVEREVPFGEGTTQQAKEIVTAQIAPVTEPLVAAVPAGTTLRALFVTERGEAFVDVSKEIAAAHAGGALNELLTVYTIVDALTANLPAITAVQILVEGKEIDTLAGHVDLRRPLASNLGWVK